MLTSGDVGRAWEHDGLTTDSRREAVKLPPAGVASAAATPARTVYPGFARLPAASSAEVIASCGGIRDVNDRRCAASGRDEGAEPGGRTLFSTEWSADDRLAKRIAEAQLANTTRRAATASCARAPIRSRTLAGELTLSRAVPRRLGTRDAT